MDQAEFTSIVLELARLPKETEWVEFKLSKEDPDEIGGDLSALSNSAALLGKTRAFIIWGIKDETHEILGTEFKPRHAKIGNEELENWLIRSLSPRIDFRIHEAEIDGNQIVMFEVPAASNHPVRFKDQEYIRIGSYSKKLKDFPEKERSLWCAFQNSRFEEGIAKEKVTTDEVLSLIDHPMYFALMQQPTPDNKDLIIERLDSEKIIQPIEGGYFNITTAGAILFARDLSKFDRLSRKALRIIIYKGNDRTETVKEQTWNKGYAIGFDGALSYINDQLPQNEQIGQALRREVRMYPEIAIRELVANALIHQDFSITGAGPMVEIFSDRMEITNPGEPLISPLRFIDEPPRSRNEILASILRRMAICEERGSGIDKVIFHVEVYQLPAPDFRIAGASTISVLYGHRKLRQMNRDERIRACYQHACILYVSGKRMSNTSLRKRLGIGDRNYPLASKIIRDTIEARLIKSHNAGVGSKRDATYIPFWA